MPGLQWKAINIIRTLLWKNVKYLWNALSIEVAAMESSATVFNKAVAQIGR